MKPVRAVLVDRDDTLCPDVPYCSDPADMHAFPDVPASVKRLNDAGYLVLMVTNQSGIGRGYFTMPTPPAPALLRERRYARLYPDKPGTDLHLVYPPNPQGK